MYYQGNNDVKQNKRQAKMAFGTACTYGQEKACGMYKRLDKLLDLRIIKK